MARFFESVLTACGEPKLAANWVMGDWSAALNRRRTDARSQRRHAPMQLGTLIARVRAGTITGKVAKSLFDSLWNVRRSARDVDALIREHGLDRFPIPTSWRR